MISARADADAATIPSCPLALVPVADEVAAPDAEIRPAMDATCAPVTVADELPMLAIVPVAGVAVAPVTFALPLATAIYAAESFLAGDLNSCHGFFANLACSASLS